MTSESSNIGLKLLTPEPPVYPARDRRWAALSLAAIVVVFVIDFFVPHGVAVGALYMGAVLLTLPSSRQSHTVAAAGLATGLTIFDIPLSGKGAPIWMVYVNRAVSIGVIWGSVILVRRLRQRHRQQLESERQAAESIRQVMNATPDGIVVVNTEGIICLANNRMEPLFGYTPAEIPGKPSQVLAPERYRERLAAHQKAYFRGEANLPSAQDRLSLRKDGTEFHTEIALGPVDIAGQKLVVVTIRDVTERQKTEERLRQTQKMESIGQIAGGVAHDLNNLLMVTLNYSLFAAEAIREPGPLADIRAALRATEKAAALVQQLLSFARRAILKPQNVSLDSMVMGMSKILKGVAGTGIELVFLPGEALWPVYVDIGLIEQVIMNLVVNARDAMPDGGVLTVETRNVTLDAEYAAQHPHVQPGDYVLLAVSDTGTGMDEKTKARAFEPFFTTKDHGKGTGLGLAMCYGIVRQANGDIWIYSELGKGTTIKVYLPRAEGYETVVEESKPGVPGKISYRFSGTILVAEDEPAVMALLARTLRRAGYTVIEAENGADALRKVRDLDEGIQLLITDVVMPQMGGRELARQMQARFPRLRVIYMSGYTDNAIVHHNVLDADALFLQKPFLPSDLLESVRKAIEHGPA